MNAIEVSHITKHYDDVQALDDVSFSVKQGEVFGLIGPDGAGKTSLFRIMASLLLADAGTVSVEGYDVVRYARKKRFLVSATLNNGLPMEANSPSSAYFSSTVPVSGEVT